MRISAYGPEYADHQWFTMLGEGNAFTSVPVSFAVCADDWQQAVAEMTLQRRETRMRHARDGSALGRLRARRDGRRTRCRVGPARAGSARP